MGERGDIFDLSGRKVLITGASSGLGAQFARTAARAGAAVALAARRADRLEALAEEIRAGGGRVETVTMDVGDPQSVVDGVARAADRLGGLDGLVNNAGAAKGGLALELSEEDWRSVMSVNLDGVFRVAQAAAKAMVAGGNGGAVVMLSSILALRVQPGLAAYSASKAAVDHLTRALALEWVRYGIRVNALAPGYFPTEMNREHLASEAGQRMMASVPMRRFGAPEDLDGPLLLLLSDAGRYITGATLPVDGGHLLKPL